MRVSHEKCSHASFLFICICCKKPSCIFSEEEIANTYVESSEETYGEQQFILRNDIFSPLLDIAMPMKQNIKDAPGIGSQWPTISAYLTLEAAFQSIPVELYNFLGWLIGCSTEPIIALIHASAITAVINPAVTLKKARLNVKRTQKNRTKMTCLCKLLV